MNEFSVDRHFKLFTISKMKNKYNHSTALKCGSFSEKNIEKKQLCPHDKNHYYFCKSSISVINLIVGSRNMINV